MFCLYLHYSSVWGFTAPRGTKQRTVKLYMCFVFLLCWIPRHSPKVVKAASQVLNSMWQYRDLRSLYKKVEPAQPNVLWLFKHWHCQSCWLFSNMLSSSLHSGWLLPVPFCWLFFHDRARQTATLLLLSHSIHLSRTNLAQQSIRWVHIHTYSPVLVFVLITLSFCTVQSNKYHLNILMSALTFTVWHLMMTDSVVM